MGFVDESRFADMVALFQEHLGAAVSVGEIALLLVFVKFMKHYVRKDLGDGMVALFPGL